MRKNIKKTQNKNPSLAALNLMQTRDLTDSISKLTLNLLDLKNQKENLITTKVNDLIERKNFIASMLLPYNYKNSHIVGSIITNNYPVKPKKKLIVVVAFVTGFILSVFLVFFMEFIQNVKKEEHR
jgi:LPS O-antigen subunit length determinant protein (WzzB/FepE family)